MASINLGGLRKARQQTSSDAAEQRISRDNAYTYKDVKLDIEFGSLQGNSSLNRIKNTSDITDLRDVDDVKQSIRNIFNTVPGQKLLNPNFGINLVRFAFEPITEQTADHIARTILITLPSQEPRITISKLTVIGDIENSIYRVNMIIGLQSSGIDNIYVNGAITSTGFNIK